MVNMYRDQRRPKNIRTRQVDYEVPGSVQDAFREREPRSISWRRHRPINDRRRLTGHHLVTNLNHGHVSEAASF